MSGDTTTVELPRASIGTAWLGQNKDLDVRTPVVDPITRIVGGSVTVFQRMNKAGDPAR